MQGWDRWLTPEGAIETGKGGFSLYINRRNIVRTKKGWEMEKEADREKGK